MKKRIALALGGGAARGWAHVGVLRCLCEHNWEIGGIAGTSIGALVGAFLCSGRIHDLWDEVAGYRKRDLLGLFDPSVKGDGLLAGQRVESFLRRYLGDLDIEDLAIPYGAVAADLADGSEAVFTTGPVISAVRASISIPGIFASVRRSGKVLVDGGLVNPVPVSVARSLCPGIPVMAVGLNRDVPAILSESDDKQKSGDESWSDRLGGGLKGWLRRKHAQTVLPLASASIVVIQQQLTLARLRTEPADCYVEPELSNVDLFDFLKAEEAMQAGYSAASEALASWPGG